MARVGVGIDIGAKAVKVAQLERRGGALTLTAALRLTRPPEAGEGALEPETAADLAENLRAGGIPAAGALVGLSGRELILRYTQVPPVPDWRLKMLMDFEIGELAGKSGGDVASDYRVLDVPPDAAGNRTVLVGLAKVESLDARLAALAAAKIPARDTCPASLGLAHAVLAAGVAKPEETLLVLDIGARNTEMTILRGGALLFARNLSSGGDQFTKAVADALGIPMAEAEEAVHREGNVAPMRAMRAANARAEGVLSAVAATASQYAAMLQSSLMFARAQTKIADLQPTRALVTGGASRLRGLAEFLAKTLKFPVEPFEPLAGISVDVADREFLQNSTEIGREMAVAIGLARAALGEPGVRLSLLPPRVLRRREFVERKLFLWGAGAAAVAFVLSSVVGAQGDLGRVQGLAGTARARKSQADEHAKAIAEVKVRGTLVGEMRKHLAAEVRPGTTFVRLLADLQRVAPGPLWVDEARLLPDKPEELGSGAMIEIGGKVGESEESTQKVLEGFQNRIRGLAGVASVEAKQNNERAGLRTFKLEVKLVGGPAPADEKDGPR